MACLAAEGGGDRDVDDAIDRAQELPERRGRVMTQYRPLPTSEHSGHPTPVPTWREVTHRVHTAVEAVQLPTLNAVPYRPSP